jgi:hypothetical protein
MSGICDTCRRKTCEYRADDIAVCGLPKTETNWERLFGTPERAAETLKRMCVSMESCTYCPLYAAGVDFCESNEGDGVAEWLESEVRDEHGDIH